MSDIEKYSDATFESIKHTNADGQEYWLARELQAVLEYTQWRRFSEVIERAKESCKNSGYSVEDHFANVGKMVAIGSGAERKVDDLMLSRYACYLIVQNGDPRKEVIAVGQTYFAVKTRQQELIENYDILSEEQKRLAIRAEMVEHNKSLAEAAKQAGVETPQEYALFQNKGYQGLYGGLGMRDIHARKGLKPNEKILDHMGSTELAANLFRATQTDEKLRGLFFPGKPAGDHGASSQRKDHRHGNSERNHFDCRRRLSRQIYPFECSGTGRIQSYPGGWQGICDYRFHCPEAAF